ncbi:hypothetical protein FQN54_006307 [Arachnomyces sp. PD_36]|nr:hypothetical protein FQN54_006307 [Arachnomyces sp. PD_36]
MTQHKVDGYAILPGVERVSRRFSRRTPWNKPSIFRAVNVVFEKVKHATMNQDGPAAAKFCVRFLKGILKLLQCMLEIIRGLFRFRYCVVDDSPITRKSSLDPQYDKVWVVVVSILFRGDCKSSCGPKIMVENARRHRLRCIFIFRIVLGEGHKTIEDIN